MGGLQGGGAAAGVSEASFFGTGITTLDADLLPNLAVVCGYGGTLERKIDLGATHGQREELSSTEDWYASGEGACLNPSFVSQG